MIRQLLASALIAFGAMGASAHEMSPQGPEAGRFVSVQAGEGHVSRAEARRMRHSIRHDRRMERRWERHQRRHHHRMGR